MTTHAQRKFHYSQFSFRSEEDEQVVPEVPKVDRRPHDPATQNLIDEYGALDRLAFSETVRPLLEKWIWEERMGSAETKHKMLDPVIRKVQEDPEGHVGELIFLLITLEPLQRSVTKKLLRGAQGIGTTDSEPGRFRREEARWVARIQRQDIIHHMRCATIQLLHQYGFNVQQGRFFSWFNKSLSWRAMEIFRRDYMPHADNLPRGEAEALQRFLHGFEGLESPPMRSHRGTPTAGLGVRTLYEHVEDYRQHPQIRQVCQKALGRLPVRMRQVMEGLHWHDATVTDLATGRGVTTSTVSHQKRAAEQKLYDDDEFFYALVGLDRVRDAARREALERQFPGGRSRDGRKRLVVIGDD